MSWESHSHVTKQSKGNRSHLGRRCTQHHSCAYLCSVALTGVAKVRLSNDSPLHETSTPTVCRRVCRERRTGFSTCRVVDGGLTQDSAYHPEPLTPPLPHGFLPHPLPSPKSHLERKQRPICTRFP